MASVSIRGVTKRFGSTEVLKGIDLELEDGEFLVLVGPSGCGKSTLLNLIAGLETLTEGELLIGTRVVNDVHPKDRDIAMVFQSYALYPTMTVRKNITFGMEIRGVPKAERKEAVDEVAKLLQIEHLLDRKPGQLSGGQRQRVAMGRALVRAPEVFLFDEPLSNLDAKLRVEMRTEIKKLHRRLGRTIVYVTHDQIEAMTLASRIALMHEGRIQQYADPITVYESPANMFVAGFIGSPPMNFLTGTVREAGGRVGVEVEVDGATAYFPLALPPDPAAAPAGRPVILGLRPETIGFSTGPVSPTAQALVDGRVEVVEPTGPDAMVVVSVGGQSLTARVAPSDAPSVGEPVRFVCDMTRACIFNPETGARI